LTSFELIVFVSVFVCSVCFCGNQDHSVRRGTQYMGRGTELQ